jgi:hypothetical protein
MMRLRPTLVLHRGDADRAPDWLARTPEDARVFVPGWLPCGECPRCRRALVAACPRRQPSLPQPAGEVELEGRFLTPVDEPAGGPPIEDSVAAAAGVVAELLEAIARAGVGPEQLAAWVGDDPRAAIGVRLAARLGAVSLAVTADPAGVAALDAASEGAPGGVRERRIFALGDQPPAIARLWQPGSTLTLLDGNGTSLLAGDLPLGRILIAGGGYHPDFVPEALSALRSDAGLLAGAIIAGATPQRGRLVLITL